MLTGIPKTARVMVDGSRLTSWDTEVELNPGAHSIEVTLANARPMVRSFTLAQGRTKTIDLVRQPRRVASGAS